MAVALSSVNRWLSLSCGVRYCFFSKTYISLVSHPVIIGLGVRHCLPWIGKMRRFRAKMGRNFLSLLDT